MSLADATGIQAFPDVQIRGKFKSMGNRDFGQSIGRHAVRGHVRTQGDEYSILYVKNNGCEACCDDLLNKEISSCLDVYHK